LYPPPPYDASYLSQDLQRIRILRLNSWVRIFGFIIKIVRYLSYVNIEKNP
jgi:hypothetical protein